jgi:uncharacterized cupredoxin-like copper-binding protein
MYRTLTDHRPSTTRRIEPACLCPRRRARRNRLGVVGAGVLVLAATTACSTAAAAAPAGYCRAGFAVETIDHPDIADTATPETLHAGVTSFELANRGAERHEMVIVRKHPGVATAVQDLLVQPDGGQSSLDTLAEADAGPGEHGSSVVNLQPGAYALICFLPVGSTPGATPPDDAPAHWMNGMISEFTVS